MAKGSPWNNVGRIQDWNQTYGGSYSDAGRSVEQTADGGYILIGSTRSYGAGNWDVWLIKTDINGHMEWNQTYGGPESDLGFCGEQTADGGYIITGYTRSYGAGNADVWLIKTDINGHAEWNQTYGGPESDMGRSGEQTTDGGYILTGYTSSYGAGLMDMWLIKTDENGHMEWNQTYGGPARDYGSYVEQTMDGGYLITGSTDSYGAGDWDWDVWLIKTDANGLIESEGSWGPIILPLTVIGIVLVVGGVFIKRKR